MYTFDGKREYDEAEQSATTGVWKGVDSRDCSSIEMYARYDETHTLAKQKVRK